MCTKYLNYTFNARFFKLYDQGPSFCRGSWKGRGGGEGRRRGINPSSQPKSNFTTYFLPKSQSRSHLFVCDSQISLSQWKDMMDKSQFPFSPAGTSLQPDSHWETRLKLIYGARWREKSCFLWRMYVNYSHLLWEVMKFLLLIKVEVTFEKCDSQRDNDTSMHVPKFTCSKLEQTQTLLKQVLN